MATTMSPPSSLSPSTTQSRRRPALIPYSAFTTISSPSDLSSLLPSRHGGTYILPPPPPPSNISLLSLQQAQLRRQSAHDKEKAKLEGSGDVEMDMDDWEEASGEDEEGDGEGVVNKRWSLKDVAMEEEEFETREGWDEKLGVAEREDVEGDLFSWVNANPDAEEGPSTPRHRDRSFTGESIPMSPTSVGNSADIERHRARLIEATRLLHDL